MQENEKPLNTDDTSHQSAPAKSMETSPNPFATFRMGDYGEPQTKNKETLIHRVKEMPTMNPPKEAIKDEPEELEAPKNIPASFFTVEEETTEPQEDTMTDENNDVMHATEPTVTLNTDESSTKINKTSLKEKIIHPEDWKSLQALPRKYRRPVVVLFFLLLILLLIAFLKPSKPSVQSFEESTPNYAMEEANDASENNGALGGISGLLAPQPELSQPTMPESAPLPESSEMLPMSSTTETLPKPQVEETFVPTPVAAETTPKTETMAKPETKPQPIKPVVTEQKTAAKPSQNDVFGDIEKAKLLKTKQVDSTADVIITIRKGMSLMQGFREHHLNLSDVMTMAKMKNAGHYLSNLDPNDKVYIQTNGKGRVMQLTLPNGSRFIRQKNGSYQFHH